LFAYFRLIKIKKALKKFVEEINAKNIKSAIKLYFAKYYRIVQAIIEMQKKAAQRLLLSKLKINMRYYFKYFKSQALKIKEIINQRSKLIASLIKRRSNTNESFVFIKVLITWKLCNFYCKMHERNLSFAQSLEKLCFKVNSVKNFNHFVERIKKLLTTKNKQKAINCINRLAYKNNEAQRLCIMRIKLFQFFANTKNQKINVLKSKYMNKLVANYNERKADFSKKRVLNVWNKTAKQLKRERISQAFFKLDCLFNYGLNTKSFYRAEINIYKNKHKFLCRENINSISDTYYLEDFFTHNNHNYLKKNNNKTKLDYLIFLRRSYSIDSSKQLQAIEKHNHKANARIKKRNSFAFEKEEVILKEQDPNLRDNEKNENLKNNFYLYDEKKDVFYLTDSIISDKNDFDCFFLFFLPFTFPNKINFNNKTQEKEFKSSIEDQTTPVILNQSENKIKFNEDSDSAELENNNNRLILNSKFAALNYIVSYIKHKSLLNKLHGIHRKNSVHNGNVLLKYLKLWRTNKDKLEKTQDKIKLIFNSITKTNNSLNNKFLKSQFAKWRNYSNNVFKEYRGFATGNGI